MAIGSSYSSGPLTQGDRKASCYIRVRTGHGLDWAQRVLLSVPPQGSKLEKLLKTEGECPPSAFPWPGGTARIRVPTAAVQFSETERVVVFMTVRIRLSDC